MPNEYVRGPDGRIYCCAHCAEPIPERAGSTMFCSRPCEVAFAKDLGVEVDP